MNEVRSHSEMISSFKKDGKNYVLLYKKGSEASDCSYTNIDKVVESGMKVNVVAADVSEVKDIHQKYDITTVPTLLVFQGDKFEKTVKGCNDNNYYESLFDSALFNASKTDDTSKQKRVTVYSTPTCSWCTTLKNHLKSNNIKYAEIDVSKDQKAAEEMVKRSGQQGVPQTDIGGQMIIGFDKVKINSLLNIN